MKAFTDKITWAEVVVMNAAFEDSIPEILAFVKKDGKKTFPFFFIDPTGWSGYAMKMIAPLLSHWPCEVLINLMGHLHRFVDSPMESTQESIRDLFGSLEFKSKLQGLSGLDKQDAVVEAYAQNVRTTGKFTSTGIAVVLHPEKDKAHFHLIYATRNPKGIEVFKDAERKAMDIQNKARASADLRRKEERTGQQDLLGHEGPSDTRHFDALKSRYSEMSKSLVLDALNSKNRIPMKRRGAWQFPNQ